ALVALATARYGLGDTGIAIALLGVGVVLFGVLLGRVGGEAAAAADPAAVRRLPAASSYGRQAGAFAIDVLLVALAYYTAYRLGFEQTYEGAEALVLGAAATRRA